jgi:hypothetical protein
MGSGESEELNTILVLMQLLVASFYGMFSQSGGRAAA